MAREVNYDKWLLQKDYSAVDIPYCDAPFTLRDLDRAVFMGRLVAPMRMHTC